MRLLFTKIAALPLVLVAVYHIVKDLPLTVNAIDAPVVDVTKWVPPSARELFAATHGLEIAVAVELDTNSEPIMTQASAKPRARRELMLPT